MSWRVLTRFVCDGCGVTDERDTGSTALPEHWTSLDLVGLPEDIDVKTRQDFCLNCTAALLTALEHIKDGPFEAVNNSGGSMHKGAKP